MKSKESSKAVSTVCYHCGQPCSTTFYVEDKPFCCFGCKTVYEILKSSDMCEYYALAENPGVNQENINRDTYAYLDQEDVYKKVIEFNSPSFAKVRFAIPAIHCSSCIWLLENVREFNHGILKAEVNLAKKSVLIDFNPKQIRLSKLAGILQSIGYAPAISLDDGKKSKAIDYTPVLKLSLAGFCFGNIMLFSFPEYLGIDSLDQALRDIFPWLNLVLAMPVLFYSASGYFVSAWKSFSQRQINIDVPIAAGLLALFCRSAFDIISGTGIGYLDSFSGLVFFLLIGRWFQSKTYESLSFDRDYASYFPLAVSRREGDDYKTTLIQQLRKGDVIRIRNMEIIPADSILQSATALIDYSFVTGESKPVHCGEKEFVYAGGRLLGQPVELTVEKATSQSLLTGLWNHDAFRKRHESKYQKIIDAASRKFTWIVMGIALVTAVYWNIVAPEKMWLILTSVLMVACPCALALAAPFTYGSMLRVFGKYKFYLKNADVIERMSVIDAVVFDKTGTITYTKQPLVTFSGELSRKELGYIKHITSASTHPLSIMISKSLRELSDRPITQFNEFANKGVEGTIDGHHVRVGSAAFAGFRQIVNSMNSHVFVSIDDEVKGYFTVALSVRTNMKDMLTRLGKRCVGLLSGDQDTDKVQMRSLFGARPALHFNLTPQDKLDYVTMLQRDGGKVMMLGDGLNDAGAMKQSDIGIAVTDDTNVFTPACDGILQGDQLEHLDKFLALARASSTILKAGFAISFFYNAIALTVAVTGHLTPLVAAILMPVSSITVVSFSSVSVKLVARHKFKSKN